MIRPSTTTTQRSFKKDTWLQDNSGGFSSPLSEAVSLDQKRNIEAHYDSSTFIGNRNGTVNSKSHTFEESSLFSELNFIPLVRLKKPLYLYHATSLEKILVKKNLPKDDFYRLVKEANEIKIKSDPIISWLQNDDLSPELLKIHDQYLKERVNRFSHSRLKIPLENMITVLNSIINRYQYTENKKSDTDSAESLVSVEPYKKEQIKTSEIPSDCNVNSDSHLTTKKGNSNETCDTKRCYEINKLKAGFPISAVTNDQVSNHLALTDTDSNKTVNTVNEIIDELKNLLVRLNRPSRNI